MCGRFTLVDLSQFTDLFPWIRPPERFEPRYNIAPSQPILVALPEHGGYSLRHVLWGLVPQWARDASGSSRMINARSETVADKPAFAAAFRYHRALVPASGFYEWKATTSRGKTPMYITRRDGKPMILAGMCDLWHDPAGGELHSGTILTTAANGDLRGTHDRMPVILEPESAGRWLTTPPERAREVLDLLRPAAEGLLGLQVVSAAVNSPAREGPELILPASTPDSGPQSPSLFPS